MKALECTASALRIRELPDGRDTGRRIMREQIVEGHGTSWDGNWTYVVAPAGEGWSWSGYLRESTLIRPERPWPRVPHGKPDIIEVFGEPCSPAATAGLVHLPQRLPLYHPDATEYATRFHCHQLMTGPFDLVFREIHRRGYWPLLEDWGGVYNCRMKKGTTTKQSTHSWGIAVDVASLNNGFGQTPTLDPRIVAIFEDVGFAWGGRWSRPDGMHFQYCVQY